jgi:hypothetical protein
MKCLYWPMPGYRHAEILPKAGSITPSGSGPGAIVFLPSIHKVPHPAVLLRGCCAIHVWPEPRHAERRRRARAREGQSAAQRSRKRVG